MRALDRKLLRDLWQMKGQALAISLVMACGVATFVMSLTNLESLQRSQLTYYERYRFADVFAHLKRAPNTLAERIAEIPGVARVQTRIVAAVTLDVPGLGEPATGRLISIPERQAPVLNALHLRSGRWVEPGHDGEVLASEAFVEAHGLQPGDSIEAVLNGRKRRLRIAGVVLSPEYIYQIREGDLLPDPKRFGVFWMGYTELAAAFDMLGAFNDVNLALMPGASEPDVLQRLDRLTEPYGGLGAFGRADQVSNRFLSDEIKQLRNMGMIVPSIFLGVAAFLLNVVLSRLINTQREQIAVLKAFGYSNLEVGLHYLKLVLLLVTVGVVLGTAVGVWLGRGMVEMYARFYRFPVLEFHLDADMIVLAFLVSSGAGVLGTLGAVRRAVRLPPAEAMRPEPPAQYRPTILERLGLQQLLPQTARMVLRELERRPYKALLSILGIATASAVLIIGSFSEDSIDFMLEYDFALVQRYDLSVAFAEPASAEAVYSVRQLPGVIHCEPFRSVPVRLRAGPRSRRLAIMGIEARGELYRILDENLRAVPLPPEGLMLSKKLGELLGVGAGDVLTVEVMEGSRPVREVRIAGLVADYTGLGAHMDIDALHRLLWEGSTVSGAFLAVDPVRLNELHATLKGTPRVAGVTLKNAARQSFEETIAENIAQFRTFNVIFACIIAFGVVYNNARIALAERRRELATLRVIGFTRAEISAILLGELAVLTLAAVPLGLLLGYGGAALVTQTMDTDLYRIPLLIRPATFAFAATVVLVAALVSGLVVRRKLDHLDLVAVLKTKE
jgi:putative ABC transport system permease protein